MRLFIAVNMMTDVKRSIQTAIDRFPVSNPPWRWVKEEAFHITLKFLGETPEDQIPQIIEHLVTACGRHRGFDIKLGRLGGFPSISRPRVLFYSVEAGVESLGRIAGDIEGVLEKGMGISKEKKPFHGHITVARIKKPLPREITLSLGEAPPLAGVSQSVRSVHLMSSELRREGARYQVVKEIALDRSAC